MKDYFLYTKCLITQQILKNRAVMRMHHAVMPKGKPSKLLYKKKNSTSILSTHVHVVLSCIKIIKKYCVIWNLYQISILLSRENSCAYTGTWFYHHKAYVIYVAFSLQTVYWQSAELSMMCMQLHCSCPVALW